VRRTYSYDTREFARRDETMPNGFRTATLVISSESPRSGMEPRDTRANPPAVAIRSERQLPEHDRRLADAMPALLFTVDERDGLDFVNHRWTDLTGASQDDMRGDGWQRFVHPDDLERAISSWRRSLRSGAPHATEWRLRCADGTYRWMRVRAERSDIDVAGSEGVWYGSAFDIDDLHRALDAARHLADGTTSRTYRDVPSTIAEIAASAR
jgi:PAS domain S-box-containing protein